jgi:iron complex outermembrane receptor protein
LGQWRELSEQAPQSEFKNQEQRRAAMPDSHHRKPPASIARHKPGGAAADVPRWPPGRIPGLVCVLLALVLPGPGRAAEPEDDLLSLSWEELNAREISTLTRKRTSLVKSPAAAFVITEEDIRRSGARTVPDILRMVPGLQVAQLNGWDEVVTARGMNGFYANKLLVMMDGRSLYNPFISGVWWGDQNLFLEDIERIEVLRGPGGSLWGANAFNGVINIVTKRSSDTQGGLAIAGAGTLERGFGNARYGIRIGEETYLRVFANGLVRDGLPREGGGDGHDGQSAEHGGFRLDSRPSGQDRVTFQGDAFHNEDGWFTRSTQFTPPYTVLSDHTAVNTAANLLGRWTHGLETGGEWTLGSYIDYSNRSWPAVGEEHLTFDLDFQHRLAPMAGFEAHEVMWGAGYRHIADDFANTLLFSVNPNRFQQDNFSVFFQDEITLIPQELVLTLGSKFEHYTLAGFQAEPNIRLSWTPDKEHNVWMAISRAVALPNRYQRYLTLTTPVAALENGVPLFGQIVGDRHLDVETVIAYELGWRYAPTSWLQFDTALFYNHYEDMVEGVTVPTPGAVVPGTGFPLVGVTHFGNVADIDTYGLELAVDYTMTKAWRWRLAYTAMGMDEDSGRLSQIPDLLRYQGTQPRNTLSLRSQLDVRDDVEFDLWLRFADELAPGAFPAGKTPIPAYLTFDARLAWQVTPKLELSVVGRNLAQPEHPEYANTFYMPYPSEVERSVYVKAALRF